MKQTATSLRFAGDVHFEKIQLNTLNGQFANIINQVISIEIYEDLFSPFISMSLVIKESVDYINMFPFIGEEYLEIEIYTPMSESPISGKFYIYKITNREMVKDREVVYVLNAISEEYLTDANRKISKTFQGNIGEIAQKILTTDGLNTKKKLIVEKTSNSTAFTANYWNPIKCINYITTTAINAAKSPSYLFFENRNGFNFRSIDELLKAPTYHKFVKDNYNRSIVGNSTTNITDPQEDYKRILDISIPTLTDYMEDIQTGRLKSRLVTHDLVTKQYSVKDYSVKKDTEHQPTLLNPYPSYSKYATSNSISTLIVMPKYYGNFTKFGDVTNANSVQRRLSFFRNLEKYKVNIQVLGRTDYTVGQVVELNIPRVTQITQDMDPVDMILSGRYLVSAISHIITKESHLCNLEVIKNSVLINLSKD